MTTKSVISLESILKKLSIVHPDLALQIVLSGLIKNKQKSFEQIDCLLTVATIREIDKLKK